MKYAKVISKKPSTTKTPQSQPLPGREEEMVKNSAGGVTFALDEWGYLNRFLIIGSECSTYYAKAEKLTKAAAKNVIKCIQLDGLRAVREIVEISKSGRAPKNDPAVFALALCAVYGDKETVKAAYEALSHVCRIGTHLFQFVSAIDELGKWNAAAKRGIAAWYINRPLDRLAVQLLKYQSRDGWSHRDVLRLAHVKPTNSEISQLFKYVTAQQFSSDMALPKLVTDYEKLKTADAKTVIRMIEDNTQITWEMIPTEHQKDPKVMGALLPTMGLTALLRKLGQLTSLGILKPLSSGLSAAVAKLGNAEDLKSQRVHPITILNALNQYKKGHGDKGSLKWSPVARIIDVLNDSFYDAFEFIESTGKGFLLGLDISGSMFGGAVVGTPNLYPAEVSAVMALAVAKRETNYEMFGFDTSPKKLKISPSMRIDTVLEAMRNLHWSGGGTDCAQPMLYAIDKKIDGVDAFAVYTDNETWAGKIQPVEALARYRKKYNPNAKLIVCGTSTTNFTIADPKDPGMLDVVGFDSAAPSVIQNFAASKISKE